MEILVYFDPESGRLLSITSESTLEELPSIVVDLDSVRALISGEDTFYQYRVVLDGISKEYVLKKIKNSDIAVKSTLYKVPKYTGNYDTTNIDFLIIQDLKENSWTIELNQKVYQTLTTTAESILNKNIELYLVSSNDVDFLEKTLTVNLTRADIFGKIYLNTVNISKQVSVYCRKYFTSYAHIIK